MRRLDIEIPGPDGRSRGTLLFPDAGGVRETMRQMGDRLADMGYVALVPDTYYRAGEWAPFDVATLFTDQQERARLAGLTSALTNDRIIADSDAYADFLLAREEVSGSSIGTTGYCMGGAISLTAAGTYLARIAAAASFHGGNLATDSDLSPHLLAASIAARVYVAGADQDNSYPPEMAARLDQALSDAGVDHRCEVYPDALHGWTMADFPVYNEAAAERHWDELVALFADTLT